MPTETTFEAKTFGRPKQFDGSESQWRDWSFAFIAYCTVIDGELGRLMLAAQDREAVVDPGALRHLSQPLLHAGYVVDRFGFDGDTTCPTT